MQQKDGSLTRSWEQWFTEVQRNFSAMPAIQTFSGDPNGDVLGVPGDLVGDTTGGANTTLWVKESGSGTNTGWTAK
jgi:hypothetical protein